MIPEINVADRLLTYRQDALRTSLMYQITLPILRREVNQIMLSPKDITLTFWIFFSYSYIK